MAKKLPGLALYLAHGNVLTAGNMDSEKLQATGKSFECVELGDVGTKKQKVPRKIIHFASGETMEEYSTDEEAGEIENRDLLPAIDTSQLTWGPYLWFYMLRAATGTLSVCDFLGERVASLFGINTPKYQYAIDEYYRIKKEEEEEEEEEEEDELERYPSGTKVKVKYGRGKNQKIYEANIRNSELDDGEVIYLVHYYGWNTRYDEWVKGDRIIWPSDRGTPKGKHRRKVKNKQNHDKDEKKEEDKQNKSKRGRPSLKSTPTANSQRNSPRTPGSDGKSGTRSMRNNVSDSSPLLNGVEGKPRRRTRRSSGMCDSDKESANSSDENEVEASVNQSVKEEVVSISTVDEDDEELEEKRPRDNCLHEIRGLHCVENTASLNQAISSTEQTADNDEKTIIPIEEARKEIEERSLKGKGRRSKTRDTLSENNTIPVNHVVTISEIRKDVEEMESSEAKELPFPSAPEEETEVTNTGLSNELGHDEKKPGKRKSPELSTPEKRLRMESEEVMQTAESEEVNRIEYSAQDCKECKTFEELELKNDEAPTLEMVTEGCAKDEFKGHGEETEEDIASKNDEDDMMPQIGPEALVCHEVDLDDLDEKEKSSSEDTAAGNSRPSTPELVVTVMAGSVPQVLPMASPPPFHQDEVRSVKSESDMTIEVDSVAGESQEGLCESESANGFDASTSSSSSITVQDNESKEKGHKRICDSGSVTPAKKQKRNHKRSTVSSKNEKNGTGNSSDSEDLPVTDASNKCTPVKSSSKSQKLGRSPSRMTSPNSKDGDKEKDGRDSASPRTYKWSFQLTDLNNLTSGERISFLQDKLQEIRKYYMSLKSEVASIDRRRKRLKKKEREVTPAAVGTSSASSETGMSPPSSASPAQNSVAVECR
uniref:AT rich interactive domain 4A (RBP1-like) n=1 Tax=Callorhinchus milii TaxID=7868 RepID=V9KAX5_CALMI